MSNSYEDRKYFLIVIGGYANSLDCYLHFEHDIPLSINLSCDVIERYLDFRNYIGLHDLDVVKSKLVLTKLSEIKASHIFCCTVVLSGDYFSI